MTKKNKAAKIAERVLGKKDPKFIPPESSETLKPCWQLSQVDFDGPWGWAGLGRELLVGEIYSKLTSFESMTWSEIAAATGGRTRGNNHHFVQVARLCLRARQRLSELQKDDVDQLFSLRLTGTCRIWGEREGRVFRILWYDPDHQVYPSSR